MWQIIKENYEAYVLGSTFFATGGGLPPVQHAAMFRDLLKHTPALPVQACSDFDPQALFISVYGVGDPSQVVGSFDTLVRRAIDAYEQYTATRIAGLIPGEIGAEVLAFQAAVCLGLPVVDSDLVGGRAAPEVSMDVFTAKELPIAPVFVIDTDGSTIRITESLSGTMIEERARAFLASHSNNGVLAGYGITAEQYAKVGILGTLSRTYSVGEALVAKDVARALDLSSGTMCAQEKFVSCNFESRDGFLRGVLAFERHTIIVKNENITLQKDGSLVACAPESIIVTTREGAPIHNAVISQYVGENLCIVIVPAYGYWQEEKNRALWNSVIDD